MPEKKKITAIDSWGQALTTVSRLLRKFDTTLQESVGISAVWYDVLLRLSYAPNRRMRMQNLSESLILTRSGATRLVDRIEKAGLICREAAAEDRRGYDAILTDEGRAVMRRAKKIHGDDILASFGSHLDSDEQRLVYELMRKVADGNG